MTSTNDQAATVAEVAVETPEQFYCGLCRGWVAIADYGSHGHAKKEER